VKLAVIPARGGSKRIPRKNIRPFCGQPIVAWPIAAAIDSGCFDRVVVSTDDPEIAQVARHAGADVPFVRPSELSDDHTGTIAVVRHAIDWHLQHAQTPSLVCCIYATAPFVTAADLCRGLEIVEGSDADFALSVTRYPFPIQRAFRVDTRGRLAMFDPEQFNTRSQDLEPAFHDAAQFYWGRAVAWQSATTLFGPTSAGVILPPHRVQDIDTLEDWIRAERMFEAQRDAP
jgi:N-acylneuraminate cytidylyltransferase